MVRHIVLFKFYENTSSGVKDKIFSALQALGPQVSVVRSWSVGWNVGSSASAYDIAEVGDFENLEDVNIFRAHPAHIALREEVRKVANWVVLDYELN